MDHLHVNAGDAVIVILLGGGDGGVITIGPHGVHIVGPWPPEVMREIEAGATLVAQSARVKDAQLSHEMLQLGGKVLQTHLGAMQGKGATGGQTAG